MLQQLEAHGLVLNNEKCVSSAAQVDYLGHVVDASWVLPLTAPGAAISDFFPPSTRGELQCFIGIVNYYCRFLPQVASTLKQLTDATRGPGSRSTQVQWSQQLDESFKKAKAALSHVAALAHPLPAAELSIAVDVGGVLQQRVQGAW